MAVINKHCQPFGGKTVSPSKGLLLSGLFLVLLPTIWAQPTTTLKPETIEAFDEYTASLEETYRVNLKKNDAAFWVERLTSSERQQIRSGKILIKNIEDVPDVDSGIIHDWAGAVFIPGVKASEVLNLLIDYERHQEIYPEAIESKTLEEGEDYVRGRLLLLKKKVLTVVLNTEHKASIDQVSEKRWHLFSKSTRIAEVRDYGSPEERELPVGEDSGFLWRLNAYWGLLQEDDGVMVECSTISLSRDIPWGLGWMIRPFVESMPRETLEATLQATRLALAKPE